MEDPDLFRVLHYSLRDSLQSSIRRVRREEQNACTPAWNPNQLPGIGAFLIAEADPSGVASHYLSVSTFQALNGWFWVVAILGFGRKHLSFNRRFLQTSNELVLPFYVLHQSVIVAVAFYVVGLNLIAIEKFLLIILASFPIIVALLYPISKINVLRFLFGMRMKNRSP